MEPRDMRSLVILLVEDFAIHAKMIRDQLEEAAGDSVRIEHVTQLSDALNRLGQGGIDAVLLDLGLPDSTFEDTLPKVIATDCDLPVIVLTLLNDLEFAANAVQQGAQDYLIKSDLNGNSLLRAIRSAIERKKMQRDLEEYAARLEQSNERLKDFAHLLAHEVKSPLTAVTSALGLLNEKYAAQFDDEVMESVKAADVAIWNMSHLVNTLLEFASFGSSSKEFREVDMETVFYQACAVLRAPIKETNASVTHDPLPVVRGDEMQMRQLLQNLIGNAIKYRGPMPPRIHVAASDNQNHWTFSVSDNGSGVAPEHREIVFEKFVRLNGKADIPGIGIGLAFCKLIAESHGGKIWLDSTPGEGSTFHFTMPQQQADPNQAGQCFDNDAEEISGVLPT
jgi:two-component system, sensor histidine kinase and response regulator